jgi:hypothetical protein
VLWWAPGTADDYLALGGSSRRFSTRRTTVDLDYARAVPLQPATVAEQFDPYGFVAHAFGAVDGHTYTNSLEAFQRNYARGFRVFEVDHVLLATGRPWPPTTAPRQLRPDQALQGVDLGRRGQGGTASTSAPTPSCAARTCSG